MELLSKSTDGKTNDKSLLFSPWRTYPHMTYPVPGHFAPCQTAKNS